MFADGAAWALLGLCCLTSCTFSFMLIRKHRENWTQPLIQRKIVSVLWMVPIYAVEAWLSLRFVQHSPLLDMARDCYEAYVVYVFFKLCVAYLGTGEGDHTKVDNCRVYRALQEQGSVVHPPPFDRFFRPVNLLTGSERFLLRCKTNILQFVLVKPVCTFVAMLLTLCGRYAEGEIDFGRGYVYVAFIDNLSVTLSLYYLVLFYVATKRALAPHKPLAKFLCVKCVVFFTWWQGLLLSILCWLGVLQGSGSKMEEYSCSELATSIQNVLIQVEMLFLAVVHMHVFSAATYRFGPSQPTQPLAALLPIDRQSLSEDLREVTPAVLPGGLCRPQSEQRVYMPPAADPSPLPPSPRGCGTQSASQVELEPNPAQCTGGAAPPDAACGQPMLAVEVMGARPAAAFAG